MNFNLPGGLRMEKRLNGWVVCWSEPNRGNPEVTSDYAADVPDVLVPLLREQAVEISS